jgi:filamentous hemagglutinin family protein
MFKHATMNRAYRLIWCEVRSTWVAVAEFARAHGKRSAAGIALSVALVAGMAGNSAAQNPAPTALPTGGQTVAGQVEIATVGSRMDVTQSSNSAIVNWDSFNIGSQAQVNFVQPSASAVILNRVLGGSGSMILGQMTANGNVFLVDPAGVIFAPGARVDVGGLVASSLGISDGNFLAAKYQFEGVGAGGAVENHGSINVANGGFVALIAPQVANKGTISAANGSIGMAAGETVNLDFDHDGLLSFQVNLAAAAARVDNSGLILADGGRVVMSAQAKDALLSTVLSNDGIVRARSVESRNGEIWLGGGSSGVVSVSGTLDASGTAAGQRGGTVKVLGDKVGLFEQAKVDVSGVGGGGTALVGGNWQGKGPEQNANVTYVGKDVTIIADAVGSGDGGKVVVWADGITRFLGSIFSRGGSSAGDGGQVEVSGKNQLAFRGGVDLSASSGGGGRLLLDPRDLIINGGATNAGGGVGTDDSIVGNTVAFATNTGADTTITEAALEAIAAGSIIDLQAENSITVGATPFTAGLTFSNNTSVTFRTRNNTGDVGGSAKTPGINTSGLSITAQGSGSLAFYTADAGTGPGTGGTDAAVSAAIGLGDISTSSGVFVANAEGALAVGTVNAHSVALTGATSVTLNGNITTDGNTGNSVTVTGPALLATGAITINTSANVTDQTGAISFTSTIDNAQALTLTAGGADVTVSGAIGNTAALTGLTITGNDISLGNIGGAAAGVSGATSVTAADGAGPDAGSITLTGTTYNQNQLTLNAGAATNAVQVAGGAAAALTTITTSGDTVTVTGAVDLNARGLTVDSTAAGGSAAGANISFNQTIDGAGALTLTGGTLGDVTITGATGNGTALTGLTITGNDISLGNIGGAAAGVSGATSVTAADGAGPDAGSITLTGTTYNQNQLTLNAGAATNAVQVAGGAAAALTTITTSGDTVTVTGAVDLNARGLTVDSTAAGGSAAGANISFNQTIDGAGALTLTGGTLGDVTITGATGNGTALTGLTITGNDISLGNIGGAAAGVSGATSVTAADGAGPDAGSITLTGTTYNQNQLTLNAGAATNAVQVAGGAAAALTTITTSGDTVTVTGAVDLNARGLTVDSTAAGGSAAGANISFNQTIDGAGALTLTGGTLGDVTITGATGNGTALTGLTITGNDISLGNIGGAAAGVSGATSVTAADGAGPDAGSITLTGTTYNQNQLTLNAGAATNAVQVAGGAAAALTTITTSGDTVTVTGAVDLNARGLTVDSTAAGGSAAGANISFNQTIDGAGALTLTGGTLGDVTITGATGNGTALTGLTITGNDISLGNIGGAAAGVSGATSVTAADGAGPDAGSITLTGTTYNQNQLTLNAGAATNAVQVAGGAAAALTTITTSGDTVTVTGAVDLNARGLTVDSTAAGGSAAGANISFNQTIDGAGALTLTGGTLGDVTITGATGNGTALTGLTITGNDISLGNIGGAAAGVSGATSVTAADGAGPDAGSITLTGTTYNQNQLTLNAGAATNAVQVAGGAAAALTTITTSGDTVTVTGAVDLNARGLTVDSTAAGGSAAGANISFNQTIDGAGALTLTGGTLGDVTITGATGNGTALTGLTITGNDISLGNIGGAAAGVSGATSVTAADGAGPDAGSITLTGTTYNQNQLTLNAGAATNAVQVAGGAAAALTTITTSGDTVTVTGAVDLNARGLTVDSTAAGGSAAGANISFNQTIDGAGALTLTGGTLGDVTITGATGNGTALTGLTITGNDISLGNIGGAAAGVSGATSVTAADGAGPDAGSITLTGTTYNQNQLTLNAGAATNAVQVAGGAAAALTTITTSGDTVTVTGAVDLNARGLTVDSTAAGGSAAGANISFNQTIDGAGALTLTGGTLGDVTITGATGNGTALTGLTITGNDISLGNIGGAAAGVSGATSVTAADGAGPDAGSITLTGTTYNQNQLTLNAGAATNAVQVAGGAAAALTTITTSGDTVTVTGAVDLNARGLTVDSTAAGGSAAGANISFNQTIDGAGALTLTGGTLGDVTITGATGNGTALTGLTITGNDISLGNIGGAAAGVSGATSVTAADGAGPDAGSITLTGTTYNQNQLTLNAGAATNAVQVAGGAAAALTTITTSGDTVTVTGAVDLNARGLTVDSTAAGGSAAGANISFNQTIDGAGALTLTGGTLGDVTITGATGNGTALTGLTITGNDISLGNIGGAAAGVSGATSVTAADGAGPDAGSITLTGTTYNQNQLTLNAGAATNAVQVAGGAAAALTTITTSGDTVTVTGAVDLNARGLTVDSTAAGGSAAGANISFNQTIDGAGALTLTGGTLGDVTITGATGNGTALTGLTITGNDISLGNIGGAAAGVSGATSVTAADGAGPDAGSITLTGTTYNQNQLTLNAGAATNAVQVAGGAAAALTTITTSGDTVTVTGAVDLNARGLTVDSTAAGGSAAGANISFNQTIDGAGALTLTGGTLGDVTITGATGNGTALTGLTITGNDISLGNIGGAAAGVSGATSVTAADGAGPDAGSITLTGTTYNQNQLTLNAGAATNAVQVAGGAAAALTTITTSGDTVTVTGAVDLNARGLTVDSTAAGGSAAGANISFNQTIDGAGALTLTGGTLGDVTITGATGNGTALTGLTITGNDISLGNIGGAAAGVSGATSVTAADGAGPDAGSITLTGTTYNQNQLTLNAGAATNAVQVAGGAAAALTTITTSGDTVTVTGAVDLNARGLTVDSTAAGGSAAGANISFNQTIDGAGALTLTGGTLGDVTITGATGNGTALTGLTITGNDISLGNIGGAAAGVSGATSVTAADGAGPDAGSITLTGTTYNQNQLTLNAGAATNAVQVAGGAAAALTTITTSGDTVTVTGAVDLNARGLTVDSTAAGGSAAGANISFNQTIDGAGALTLTGGTLGDVTITGATGNGTALTGLTITGNDISLGNIGGAAAGVSGATLLNGSGAVSLGTSKIGGYLDISAGGAISQSGLWTIGGNLWAETSSGDIALNGYQNVLGGTVSLITQKSSGVAGAGNSVSIWANSIKVGKVRPSDSTTTDVGITGARVRIKAPSGSAIQADGTQGLVTADEPLGTTPALTIMADGVIGDPATGSPTSVGFWVKTKGLVKVVTDALSGGTVMLFGEDTFQPKYEFSGDPNKRSVKYNGVEATNAQLTGALDAAYLDIRNQTTEIRESGFAKENASKVLRRGVVTSAGPGQPAVDDSTGMAGAEECEGGFANDSLSCQ